MLTNSNKMTCIVVGVRLTLVFIQNMVVILRVEVYLKEVSCVRIRIFLLRLITTELANLHLQVVQLNH